MGATLPRRVVLVRAVKEHPQWLVLPGLVVVAVLAYVGYHAWLAHRPLVWSGTVEARTLLVGSRVGGRVARVLVQEGTPVRAGQPLVKLEPGDWPAQRLEAEGRLQQARAELEKLLGGVSTPEGTRMSSRASSRAQQIARARAELQAAEAALRLAALEARRARTLARQQVISRADLDKARSALAQARGERNARRAALAELRRGREEDLRAQQGAVDAARGRLESVDVALEELTIRAPVPARVQALELRPGDILAPDAPAATLLEESQLYVRIYVPETHLDLLRPGQEVPVRVDAFEERTFPGVVEFISLEGEYTPRNLQTADERANQVFAVRIGLGPASRSLLRAGMAAYVTEPRQ